ncbi:MAG TPA: glycosyltransferase family A protein [Opitutaceae bacterium]|nr:glycosyltransferase family A protein [Opitutaceae bacterium]
MPPAISIGILAWNEEDSIGAMLESLLSQTLFRRLSERGEGAEIVVLANGCTDGTVRVGRDIFAAAAQDGRLPRGTTARVEDIEQPGRNNAWNLFVHSLSDRRTSYICFMDADILIRQPDTMEKVFMELETNQHLGAASDCPVKDIAGKKNPSLRERLSLATSEMTGTIEGRLNGMLYCIRSGIARNLYLPRDVVANDDGFFKAAICTDFFRVPLDKSRVVSVVGATHFYQPYLSLRDVINNQKRQMIGQTTVHVVIEHVKSLPAEKRADLAETLRRNEEGDPDWLKRLIEAHLAAHPRFWQIFPGILGFRWKRLVGMKGHRKVTHFPAAAAGFAVTLVACWEASRFLRRGVATYWPKTERQAISAQQSAAALPRVLS